MMEIVSVDGMDYLVTVSTIGDVAVWDILEFLKEIEGISQ